MNNFENVAPYFLDLKYPYLDNTERTDTLVNRLALKVILPEIIKSVGFEVLLQE